jgi:hypothetical protein
MPELRQKDLAEQEERPDLSPAGLAFLVLGFLTGFALATVRMFDESRHAAVQENISERIPAEQANAERDTRD